MERSAVRGRGGEGEQEDRVVEENGYVRLFDGLGAVMVFV